MSISKPGKQLLAHVPLSFVRHRVAGGGRKSLDAAIPLVPFIDFLITLVVFLLSSFSASGELPSQGIVVPHAANGDEVELAPIVAIDAHVVTLDGRRVADTNTLAQTPGLERVEQIVADLSTIQRNWSILHPHDAFSGAVILQADRGVDIRVVRHVMFSAAQAGFTNISFAVDQTSHI